MRIRSQFITLTAVSIAVFACTPTTYSQSFAGSGAVADTSIAAPAHTNANLGPVPDKLISVSVHEGVLTVDGMVAKVHLNYNIKNQGYLYFFLPGSGTAIVSLSKMDGATHEKAAIHGSTLTVQAGYHTFELTCEGKLLDGEAAKAGVYVRFDPETPSLDNFPMMGFGNDLQAPYKWPGSRPEPKSELSEAHVVAPPPVPVNLLPKLQPSKKKQVSAPSPVPAPVATVGESL